MDEPLSKPPSEEGNDQEVAEGTEVTPVTEDDLQDAPKDDPNAPVDPEEDVE